MTSISEWILQKAERITKEEALEAEGVGEEAMDATGNKVRHSVFHICK